MASWSWPVGSQADVNNPFSTSHHGVDIARPLGSPVIAPAGGTIERAGMDPDGYGNLVVVDTPDGFRILLAHLQTMSVKPNQPISAGQPIGTVGQTGNATGPHLHLEVRNPGDIAVNPINFFDSQTEDTSGSNPSDPTTPIPPAGAAGSKVGSAFASQSPAAVPAAAATQQSDGPLLLSTPIGPVNLGFSFATMGFMVLGGAIILISLGQMVKAATEPIRASAEDAIKTVGPAAAAVAGGPAAGMAAEVAVQSSNQAKARKAAQLAKRHLGKKAKEAQKAAAAEE